MLSFAHIPTGTTVNKAIDVDDSKGRAVAPATAPTKIGAGIKPAGLHLKKRLWLSHKRGPPHSFRVEQQGRGDVVVQRRVYETFDIHLNEGDCLVHLFKGDPNGGMSAEAQVFALVQLDAASRSR